MDQRQKYLSCCSGEAISKGGGVGVEGGGTGGGGAAEDRAMGRCLAATEQAGLLRLYRGGMVKENGVEFGVECVWFERKREKNGEEGCGG
ncbi:hypothetical protein JCGZ_13064 [Jatropha curcas]|uniref:Uncharacterized protein n=1 Tax=Jatropha curcas TaxID=180498 RepID=A0A067KAY7_JATCU|nr:hypothetical protein JCGZ_13064 [Jatropha curcas]